MKTAIHLIALWFAVVVLAALHIIHVADRNLTVRRLAVVNFRGEERIVLRTLGPDSAYVDLSDGSGDNNENRVQIYTIGDTWTAGISVNNGLGVSHRAGGIEMLASPVTCAQIHTINPDGSATSMIPGDRATQQSGPILGAAQRCPNRCGCVCPQ